MPPLFSPTETGSIDEATLLVMPSVQPAKEAETSRKLVRPPTGVWAGARGMGVAARPQGAW